MRGPAARRHRADVNGQLEIEVRPVLVDRFTNVREHRVGLGLFEHGAKIGEEQEARRRVLEEVPAARKPDLSELEIGFDELEAGVLDLDLEGFDGRPREDRCLDRLGDVGRFELERVLADEIVQLLERVPERKRDEELSSRREKPLELGVERLSVDGRSRGVKDEAMSCLGEDNLWQIEMDPAWQILSEARHQQEMQERTSALEQIREGIQATRDRVRSLVGEITR